MRKAALLGSSASQARGFTTKWTVAGDAAARTITLPLVQNRFEGALSYNAVVDWGDGTSSTVTAYNDPNRIHTYASDGTYVVEVRGVMEGWSFNNAGDVLKVTDIVYWGNKSVFNGFKYVKGGFYGAANLATTGVGPIPLSGTGVLIDGFESIFRSCTAVTSINPDLFKLHVSSTTFAFRYAFQGCSALTSIPANLFRYNTNVSSYAFYWTFRECTSLTTIDPDVFRYNVLASSNAFFAVFLGCTALTTIPSGIFRYNTQVSDSGFAYAFYNCSNLTGSTSELFRYNTLVSTSGFSNTFSGCTKLTISGDTFFAAGGEATRFLSASPSDFTNFLSRASFAGAQGTAPELWNCDFGEVITLDVAPATDWDPGDVVTGQSSGATAEVVSRTSALVYKIKKHFGTFTLGEVVGVTGVPAKLADQGAANPTFAGTPVSAGCFGGAGNSLASIDNYNDIPASWK